MIELLEGVVDLDGFGDVGVSESMTFVLCSTITGASGAGSAGSGRAPGPHALAPELGISRVSPLSPALCVCFGHGLMRGLGFENSVTSGAGLTPGREEKQGGETRGPGWRVFDLSKAQP